MKKILNKNASNYISNLFANMSQESALNLEISLSEKSTALVEAKANQKVSTTKAVIDCKIECDGLLEESKLSQEDINKELEALLAM